jgi:hypothetical protein
MLDILLNNLNLVFTNKESLFGLILPFTLSIFFMIFDFIKKKTCSRKVIISLCFILSIVTSSITIKYGLNSFGQIESLSFSSLSPLFIGFYIWYTREKVSFFLVFYFTFFSSLIVDLIYAPNSIDNFLYGIGGAGFFDGLLVVPIIYTITFIVFDIIKNKNNKDNLLF